MASVPIYDVLADDAGVVALLGTPLRVYGWGRATSKTPRPYLVWQVTTGGPENNLSSTPDFDRRSVQVDIYADTSQTAESVALQVRDSLESIMHITAWYGEMRDDATDLYRFTFSVDWFVPR